MWRKLIPMLVIALAVYLVWQEVTQGKMGVVEPGVVTITSNTDAQLYVDGQLSGTIRASQMRVLNGLKPGRHIIGLSALGYKSKNVGVMVENGQRLEQAFQLEAEVIGVPKTKTVGFNDLERSINNAEEDAVLFLAAGDYQLSRTIRVQKSISLIGSGQTKTRVLSSASVALMGFKEGKLRLKGINFVHIGQQKADVFDVKDATIDIEDCRFAGGYSTDKTIKDGDGLWLHGRSSGKIINSYFERNALNGLEIRGNSNVVLDNNQFNRNQAAGLSVWESAQVKVTNSRFLFNQARGVQLSDNAFGSFENNVLTSNKTSALSFFDSASGSITKNAISGSKWGIGLNTRNTVSVSRNTFYQNKTAIYIFKKSKFTPLGNTFQGNDQNIVYEK
jgi:Right handed beta helix region